MQRRFVQEEIQVRDIEELSTRRQATNMAYRQADSFKPKDPRRTLETRSLTFSILLCLPRWIMKQLLPYKASHKTWRDACSVSRTQFQTIFWDCSFETIFWRQHKWVGSWPSEATAKGLWTNWPCWIHAVYNCHHPNCLCPILHSHTTHFFNQIYTLINFVHIN